MSFHSLNLIDPILRAIETEGYEKPTPIQLQAIPIVLTRKDLLACAQTGTGKTAAFALPILQILKARSQDINIRALILTPTRELASQIAESFSVYGKGLTVQNAVIFGGVSQKSQVKAIQRGVDVLIATPGRLLDLMQQKLVKFPVLEVLVLDEADRMLDMGFINDVKKIIASLPRNRQTLFFSATMPHEIRKLSEQILSNPISIEVTPVASVAQKIQQFVYFVQKKLKTALLLRLLESPKIKRGVVFTRTKHEANRVCKDLNDAGIRSVVIHGNKSQAAREQALLSIKSGEARMLVATDIASRGIDIDDVTHVFNHDIPNIPESYVHRIGRTARAGAEGSAFSFCSSEEETFLADIERLIKRRLNIQSTPEGLVAKSKTPDRAPQRSKFGKPTLWGGNKVIKNKNAIGTHARKAFVIKAQN